MNYNELNERIPLLQQEDFGLRMLDEVTTILSRARDIYLSDLVKLKDSKKQYNNIVNDIIKLLLNKIDDLNLDISNRTIKNLIISITSNSMIIEDISIIDEIVLLTGKNIFNPNGIKVSKIYDIKLNDITSYKFVDFSKKITYFNSPIGRKVITKIVYAINNKLKEFFNTENDLIFSVDGNILYNVPLFNIYLDKGLNEICDDLVNKQNSEFKFFVKYNINEVYEFSVKMNNDEITIDHVNCDIWKLSENNTKKDNNVKKKIK